MLYQALQKKHPIFTYQNFSFHLETKNNRTDLRCKFIYQLTDGFLFTHQVIFHHLDPQLFSTQPPALISQLVFNLGLIEMFSYWKLACSPTIKVDCGSLDNKQINFWQELLIEGMSEYFYVNQIDFTIPNFIKIIAAHHQSSSPLTAIKQHRERLSALNLGGGKDSAVVLSSFISSPETFVNLIVSPASPATTRMADLSGHPTHFVSRQFDPKLFALNRQHYLNGHVPFSASLAFINALSSVLYDFNFAVVGNEHSADELSLSWLGQPINHQFSKSTKFEQRFREYSSKYLIKNFEYFSFIRPLSELKVAQIFCTNPTFFKIFKSCNQGQQADIWCQNCPKCLFVFLTLFPFLDEKTLTTKIFSRNLFDDLSFLDQLRQLLGLTPIKPLECIGTIEESRAAFALACAKYHSLALPLPALLAALETETSPFINDWLITVSPLLNSFYQPHFLPNWALQLLENQLKKTPNSVKKM